MYLIPLDKTNVHCKVSRLLALRKQSSFVGEPHVEMNSGDLSEVRAACDP